jgi:hypothetical protein
MMPIVLFKHKQRASFFVVATADVRWIDPPKRFGIRTKPSTCGFLLLLRNNFT